MKLTATSSRGETISGAKNSMSDAIQGWTSSRAQTRDASRIGMDSTVGSHLIHVLELDSNKVDGFFF
jgi:hypothetical protein